jgi:RES domain-containing protein
MASRYKGPLQAFRIARAKFSLFDGTGAAIGGARWNTKGQRVIYAAESYATALLEILVHSNLGRVPRGFGFIEIHVPAEVDRHRGNHSEGLAKMECPRGPGT